MQKIAVALLAALLIGETGGQLGPAAVPPPVTASGANCERPEYATDQIVCADPELLAIDRDIDALAIQLGEDALAGIEPTLEAQSAWFRRRSMCAFDEMHRQCAIDAYSERQSVLLGLKRLAAAPKTPTLSCRLFGSAKADYEAQFVAENLLGLLQADQVVGVAMLDAQTSSWQPYLSYPSADTNIVITRDERALLVCQPLID